MTDFDVAVRALIDGLAVGAERVTNAYSYIETMGTKSTTWHARELLVRESTEVFVRVAARVRDGDPVETRTEMSRWSAWQFTAEVLSSATLRSQLGLPEPTDGEVVDRVIERLRRGEKIRQGGADDNGGHSGRPITGGWDELRFEKGAFVFESESFIQQPGGVTERTNFATSTLSEQELREKLLENGPMRYLAGLPRRCGP